MPNAEILGPLVLGIIFVVFAVTHRAASRDPHRNFITQLLDGWYSNWHEPAGRRRRLLKLMSVGYLVMAAAAFAFGIVAIFRGGS